MLIKDLRNVPGKTSAGAMSKLADCLGQYETEFGSVESKAEINRNRLLSIGEEIRRIIADEFETDAIYSQFGMRVDSEFVRGRDDTISLVVTEKKRRLLWWYSERTLIKFSVLSRAMTNFDRIFVECRGMNDVAVETFIIDEDLDIHEPLRVFVEPRLRTQIAKRLFARKHEPGPARISRTVVKASSAPAPSRMKGDGAASQSTGNGEEVSWPPLPPHEDLMRQIREIMTAPLERTAPSPKNEGAPEQDAVSPKTPAKGGRRTPHVARTKTRRTRSSATPGRRAPTP
jgi:hypothetical protein